MLGALGALLFTCTAAAIFYKNTQRLLASHELEGHSQEVLNLLELTARQMERGDYLSRLYLITRSQDDLNTVRTTGALVDTDMEQLRNLVRDPGQRSRAQNAASCVQELKKQFNAQLQQSTEADGMSLTRKVLECRDIISRMQVQEAILLKQRTSEAQQITYQNLIAGVVFLLVSLTVVLILFGFLLRDARKAIETDKLISDTNERLGATVKSLEVQASESSLLTSLRGELQLCTTPAEAYRTAQRYVAQVLPAAKIALFTVNQSRQLLELATTSDHQAQLMDGVPLNACCSLRGARARHRKPGNSEVDCSHFLGTPPQDYLCLPMAAHGQALGIFYLECAQYNNCDQLDIHLNTLQRLAEMSSMWIAGLNLIERFERESIRDGLTNLFNRRFMEISLDRELRLAARRKGELSLLMLDIDHFKRFNDTFGHEAGDQILSEVAEILRESVRTEDIVCRYGGEEFLVILPGMGADASFQRAEDIRQRVSKMRLDFHREATNELTISIGVSTYPQVGQAVEELVRSADRALYNAKESGRNRVVVAESAIAV